jgi:hypothetical protein
MQSPVLVRERLTDVDRASFTAEANQTAVLNMSVVEQAPLDAQRLPDTALASLSVGTDQSIDQALKAAANQRLVRTFIASVPENERAALVDASGALSQTGIQRLKAALFAKTYTGDSGQRLTATFFESLDPGIKRIEQGMMASLPAMARAESLIRSGYRDPGLSLADDLARVVDVMARLREQGLPITNYLSQTTLFERELTPFQERLLLYLNDISNSPKRVREFISAYAEAVMNAPAVGQMAMFDVAAPTKGEILDQIVKAQAAENAAEQPLFAGLAGEAQAGTKQTPAITTPAPQGSQLAGREVAPAPQRPEAEVPAEPRPERTVEKSPAKVSAPAQHRPAAEVLWPECTWCPTLAAATGPDGCTPSQQRGTGGPHSGAELDTQHRQTYAH